MKRSSTWFALILIASALLLSGAKSDASKNPRPNKHQEAADKETQTAKPLQPEPSIPLRDFEAAQAATLDAIRALHAEQEARAKENRPNYPPIYAPANMISLGLLVVGIVYSIFAWKQWAAIKQQAEIANAALIENRKAADAAKKNADALMNAERAWLLISRLDRPILVPIPKAGTATPVEAVVEFKVYGNTPAIISAIHARFIRLTSIEELPPEPDYERGRIGIPANGLVLAPAQWAPNQTTPAWPIGLEDGLLTEDEIAEIERRESFLYCYGVARYTDSFERPHETRFGFLYSVPHGFDSYRGWTFAGPASYNHHT